MGYVSQRNQPLGPGVIPYLLHRVRDDAEGEDVGIAAGLIKFGTAIALATCASLRGAEVFLLDLAGLWKYFELGQDGVLPVEPMRKGADLTNVPYVIVPLVGEFKGELGTKHHLIAIASCTVTGIEMRWWLSKLMKVRAQEGSRTGPAFGYRDGSVATISDYDDVLHSYLKRIQAEKPELIAPSDPVEDNYSLYRTFRRTAEGKARVANLDSGDQNAMNRWRKIEVAKGKRPRFNMVEHYSHAKELIPVTWRYSYVQ
jgi:hypothetical protein